MQSMTFIGQNT